MGKNTFIRKRRLENGWEVFEYDHSATPVHTGVSSAGGLAEFVAGVTCVPSKRLIAVYHFEDATDEQRASSVRFAVAVTEGRCERYPWTEGTVRSGEDARVPARWVDIGDHIDEASAFERLRRGLHTEDAIDFEFESIVQHLDELNEVRS